MALIAGPTASGKSALAMALAEREGGTVINADASQVYCDLRILTARPSAEEEARVPHRLYGYRAADDACSAADWAEDARAAIAAVLEEGRLPILVGGTGLYFRVLLDGIAPVPPIDPAVRSKVRELAPAAAHAALTIEDAAAAARLHPHDTSRTQRALEVVRSTGKPLAVWQQARVGGIRESITPEVTKVDPPLADLYARCDARAETILDAGGIEEVQRLLSLGLEPSLPIMRAIGVAPIADLLAGNSGQEQTLDRLRQATRNYAKRQRTWFRNQPL
ncbi:tRNA dimethylallyltransferase [Sphingomonas vulcanisoli]|uniref:tRNA dimethylallyltransferase n=1 Tax=Sphingomonas vulcanisoli TaxID=1658060 RepID=A0ABX0TR45_9SPHN|nr:tRNA dimethylallyltransferase [Sphingomonas vulcanisoli]